MKIRLTLLLLFISFFTLGQNSFYLSCNQVFGPNDNAIAYLNNYYHNGHNIHNKEVQMVLYEVKDPEGFFANKIMVNYQSIIPDSLLKQMPVRKHWQEKASQRYNSPITLGQLKEGIYVLEALYRGETSQIPIIISNYSMTTKIAGKELLVYMSDRNNGKSLEGFTTYAYVNNETITPDRYKNSVAHFDFSGMGNAYYYYVPVIAIKDGKVAVSQSYFYNYYNGQDTQSKSYVFTDRSVYRPEQVVHFKGLFRLNEGFKYVIPEDSIVYKILDANQKEVANKKVALDKTGGFSDSIYIDKTMPLGTYYIHTHIQGTSNQNNNWWYNNNSKNTCSFKIEEYKKPEYEVTVSLDKAQYLMGDEMQVTVDATYFFGSPVTNAEVEYKVVREEYFVPWYYRYWYWWWYEDYYNNYTWNREVIQNGTGKMNEEGQFKISIPTNTARAKGDKNYKYTVIADVRDASRRTITGSKTVVVANTEFTLSAYSEKYYVNPDEDISIVVAANDYSRQPVVTEVKVQLLEHRYANSGTPLATAFATTDDRTGEAVVQLKAPHTGYYNIRVEARDSRGKITTTTCWAYVLGSNDYSYNWWQNNSGAIQIMTDKKVYNAGEQIKAMVYVPHEADAMVTINSNHFAYYDVHSFEGRNKDNGQSAGTFRELTFEIDENAYGKLELFVGYLHNNNYYQRKEFITVIPKDQYLNVDIVFDQAQYKPGNMAYAKVRVTDAKGRPVPNASVSLGTVDESIFAMHADNTKDIRQVFYESQVYNNNVTYQNYYNTYSYSRQIEPEGISWRKSKIGDIFDRYAYLNHNEWYRYNYISNNNNTPTISGYVIDHHSGKPIKGALVKVGNKRFHTDKEGYYSLQGFKLSHVDITFSYGQHSTIMKHIPLYTSNDFTLNVAIAKNKDKTIELAHDPRVVDLATMQEVAVDDMEELSDEITATSTFKETESTAYFSSARSNDASGGAIGGALGEVQNGVVVDGDFSLDSKLIGSDERKKGKNMGRQLNAYKKAEIRSDFQDVIYWNPNVMTNPWGEATVKIKLPDNLTTWRTTARVITADTKVGQTIAKVIVRKDLLVRMETPRFMTIGDELLIATNVHNYLSTPKDVKVKLVADGLEVEGTEQIIRVEPRGEQRIDWKVNSKWAYHAKLTVEALTDEESDAMEVEVPVLPHGLEMVTAQSMYLTQNDRQNISVQIPQGVDLNAVNLQVSTAPSITSAILASMDDLIGYPYGCVEQTMSRFLPNVIVANTLQHLGNDYASTIDMQELRKMTAQGTKRLKELQHNDGGWGWWENDRSHPWMTAYVCNGIYLAKNAGYDVDSELYNRATAALRRHASQKAPDPTTHAYLMMVAMEFGMDDLWDEKSIPKKTSGPYETSLWIQAATLAKDTELAKKMLSQLEESAIREGSEVLWGDKKFYYSWQNDQVETTANAIRAIAMVNNEHSLLPGAVQWIMRQRRGKSWYNTRQTAMTIFGLNEIIKKELNPNLELEIYANGMLIQELTLNKADVYAKGHTIDLKGQTFMASTNGIGDASKYNVLRNGSNTIKVVQKGKGTCYVNTRLTYFLEGANEVSRVNKENDAFKVVRTYYKLEKKTANNGKLTYRKVPINFSKINSGDDIFVKVLVTSKSQHDYVLIEDPIPAGCEFIRETKGYMIEGEANYDGQNDYWNNRYWGYWNWNRWYAHREYRDSKLAMTVTSMPAGSYQYSYLLKAQIPGTFKITPAVAQLMYYPENRGFSNFESMTINE